MKELSERLHEQAKAIEDMDQNSESIPDLEAIKSNLYEAAQEVDRLNATVKDQDEKINKSQEFVTLGQKKVDETKTDTLRLLKAVCEHESDKDMGKHDRMKERFEKETLTFEAIERYHADAQAEFDKLFPPEPRSKGGDMEKPVAGEEGKKIDPAEYKIKTR